MPAVSSCAVLCLIYFYFGWMTFGGEYFFVTLYFYGSINKFLGSFLQKNDVTLYTLQGNLKYV